MQRHCPSCSQAGHTLIELVVAMVCSAVLLAGLGSVMMIGSQVAYTPSAAIHRTESADIVNQIAEELRYATLIIQQTPQILEFVVADRNGDGTAEKIRYAWSGTPGDPLYRTYNAGAPSVILDSADEFAVGLQQKSLTTTLPTTGDSAEAVLVSNANVGSTTDRSIDVNNHSAQRIDPANFVNVPGNALYWNATKLEFYSTWDGAANETVRVQLRATGDPNDGLTSNVLAQVDVPENTMTDNSWNSAVFASPARELALHRKYIIVWSQPFGGGKACKLKVNDSAASGVFESADSGVSWAYMTSRQTHYRLYGTYTTPGPSYNVMRNYVPHVSIVLRSSGQSHSRIDARVPLANMPELVSAHWRADFDRNPTTTDANGDFIADWAMAGGDSFDTTKLINGVWYAAGALETRPLCDFTMTTTIDVRCRNTTVGGNGAVLRINADRQGGQHAPILVYVQGQSDGTQTLTLIRKPSDSGSNTLFTRQRLSSDFIRYQVTILPQYKVVNLRINGEDQGTFAYKTYSTTSSDRFLTIYADTSLAEFDYVDVRVATN